MKRTTFLLAAAAALAPTLAFAAGPEVLNLRDGVPRELLGKMLGIAWGLFGFSLVLGLLVEAFRSDPTQTRNYAGVAWRALLVIALLGGYPKVFGTIITTAESVADRLAPQDIWETFNQKNIESIQALARRDGATAPAHPADSALPQLVPNHSSDWVNAYFGGVVFDSFVAFFVAVAQAFQWAFFQFARILLALFYVLGPLALVFYIPEPSETAGRWFKAFVTIATWSIFSSLLLALATALLFRTHDSALNKAYATAFGAVASSLLLVVLNLAVPFLASAIVGGSVRNIIAPSLAAAAFGALKASAALAPLGQKLQGFAQGLSQPPGSIAHSATDALRSTLSPESHHPSATSGPSTPATSVAPPAFVPTANERATHNERPPGQQPLALTFVSPASFPRPPGLSTKDLTLPPPAKELDPTTYLPRQPPLPPERTASIVLPPPPPDEAPGPTPDSPADLHRVESSPGSARAVDSTRPPPPPPDAYES